MTANIKANFEIRVDLANPGQFFACCGLLELANRLWPAAVGWFDETSFRIHSEGKANIGELVRRVVAADLDQIDSNNETSSPIQIRDPFHLRLDWWEDERAGGKELKVWAGSMRGVRIARAMQAKMSEEECQTSSLLDFAAVVYDPSEPDKKVEPFYFDARRGSSALPIDIGFSPDALQMTNLAYPAVEFFCLVGLQRFRPACIGRRLFEYHTWSMPLDVAIAPAAAAGLIQDRDARTFRFQVAFRTDQRKHKAFIEATLIEGEL
jgi:CRISPR-associated protein Csb3